MITIKNKLFLCAIAALLTASLTACSGLLDTDSDLVEFQKDNSLNSETDSVYSVMGIIHKMQVVADRSVLLGDVRSDLTATTDYANGDLKALAAFEVEEGNRYNQISDYYAIINNCNYYLTTVDTNLTKRGHKIFEAEYAVVKTYRAWTYLQTVLAYGNIPLVTKPLLTEKDAEEAMSQNISGIKEICNYFIDDLKPYIQTPLPQWSNVNNMPSRYFFIPVRVMLAELCLWAERYQEAATYYHDFLTYRTAPYPTYTTRVYWNEESNKFTEGIINGYSLALSSSIETFCFLPMDANEYDGVVSDIENIYESTKENNYYAQAVPSQALFNLSASQDFCMRYKNPSIDTYDTIYAPKKDLLYKNAEGDLRLFSVYNSNHVNRPLSSNYSPTVITNSKAVADRIPFFRTTIIYLHFAEALNRAGYPQAAFAVLKNGLYEQVINNTKFISSDEREAAGELLNFDVNTFTGDNTQGVHSRGCGKADADKKYAIPALASKADTITFVEDKIVTELALETMFEGHRYYDLMRVALRRGTPEYLAEPIARRNGTEDAALKEKLMNTDNWYLKK